MCGNLYGSNEVVNANAAEGKRIRKENFEKYNYSILTSDKNECRKLN